MLTFLCRIFYLSVEKAIYDNRREIASLEFNNSQYHVMFNGIDTAWILRKHDSGVSKQRIIQEVQSCLWKLLKMSSDFYIYDNNVYE